MASGKSCSVENPDGIRRTVNGKKLAPRSKRNTERILNNVQRFTKDNDRWVRENVVITSYKSLVFLD